METANHPVGPRRYPSDHPYAFDIDLEGPQSLLHRIDVSQTVVGHRTLRAWLGGYPGTQADNTLEHLHARQPAVKELAEAPALRSELQALGRIASGDDGSVPQDKRSALGKLDDAPLFDLIARPPSLIGPKRLLLFLPVLTLSLAVAAAFSLVPGYLTLVGVALQLVVLMRFGGEANAVFDLVAARRGRFEAFANVFALLDVQQFKSEHLQALQKTLRSGGHNPVPSLRKLDRLAGYAEMRTQVLFHIPLNLLLLWDLYVLFGIEKWVKRSGTGLPHIMQALGSFEALSSLAVLAEKGVHSTFPTLRNAPQSGIEAKELIHPLIPPGDCVPNSLRLAGPGNALIVTGSNMAGKSTFLRAVGLNIAMALAGGPVLAESFSVSPLRLRSSMRASDSLQQGSSYFHAELQQLRRVTARLDEQPPVFFLLDELLRGTNEHARHTGAKSIVLHLMAQGAFGIVATHDIALAQLETETGGSVSNAHFTDIIEEGEMRFDYRIQPGVVKGSNALRLLEEAGIPVQKA